MQNYRKVAGQTIEEIMESDFWHAKKNIEKDAATMFNNVGSHESEMMNFTKNYKLRMKLNRELEHSEDFRVKYLTNEYGNYEKYEKQKVETKYDEGPNNLDIDRSYELFMNLIKKLPTKEAEMLKEDKKETFEEIIEDTTYDHFGFQEHIRNAHISDNYTAVAENEWEEVVDFFNDPENFEKEYEGRLSLAAKETIYRQYLVGKSVKDLSLQFGILQQRVKAIVHQKHMYWEEVYPRLGETHMRLSIEREAIYASEFPFIEYGQDLHVMAAMEKGIRVERFTNTDYDYDPPRELKASMEKFFYKQRPRYQDRIPREVQGKAHK